MRGGTGWVQVYCTGCDFHDREDIVPIQVTRDGQVTALTARARPGRYRGPSYGLDLPGASERRPRSAHEFQCPKCKPRGRGLWRINDRKLAQIITACRASNRTELDMSRLKSPQ